MDGTWPRGENAGAVTIAAATPEKPIVVGLAPSDLLTSFHFTSLIYPANIFEMRSGSQMTAARKYFSDKLFVCGGGGKLTPHIQFFYTQRTPFRVLVGFPPARPWGLEPPPPSPPRWATRVERGYLALATITMSGCLIRRGLSPPYARPSVGKAGMFTLEGLYMTLIGF